MTEPTVCPRCGSADTEPGDLPRYLHPGDPVSIVCRECGVETRLDNATGDWDLT